MNYKLINNITGWLVFIIASFTYISTVEPTASFWDCGEFIATSFKLEVGHPPGAPLFMIMARVASLFASDVTNVAYSVNILSALASAFTILFLFWSITHLAKKIVEKEELSNGNIIAIIGSGIVGALAYTFSDSFWFSAVEAEVYAMSSLFTAVVFWAILKWENISDQQYANRWIILIAYLMGLSIGVHLLNLLAIPAIVFVYYFKNYKPSKIGVISASIVAIGVIAGVMYGIIPGTITIATKFELLFVNNFGFGYNTGAFFYIALLVITLVLTLYYTAKKETNHLFISILFSLSMLLLGTTMFLGSLFFAILLTIGIFILIYIKGQKYKAVLNTIVLAGTVILIGYSSFTMVIIRSLANPPLDENNPDNAFALLSYLNREQYGDRPLFYGQYYNAPYDEIIEGAPTYIQKDGKYVISDYKQIVSYDKRFNTVFPRMYSPQKSHMQAYKEWGNVEGQPIKITNPNTGEMEKIMKPTFFENLTFFFNYQIGHMYMRYFFWNFVGRENDIQGHGSVNNGNWISGIPGIAMEPNLDILPDSLKNNKARNVYFFLPLLLGLVGLFYQAKSSSNNFWVVMLLFLFTGLAIVVYLNQYPYQPRERDYAYSGSFYAFTIWIGLGVFGLYKMLTQKTKIPKLASAIAITIITLFLVPGIMASQNWDDHDRSNRYTARDFAKNYLNSCEPNAILFTNGDNDTFPLWYVQEVEGFRTDVRVVNLSLLNTDWYINQVRRQAYGSAPVPFSLSPDKYVQGTRDSPFVLEKINEYTEISRLIEFVSSDDPETKLDTRDGQKIEFIPTKMFKFTVDSATVVKNGVVKPKDASKIVKEMKWNYSGNYMPKADMMVLDLISTNNWKRPIYFAITVGSEGFMGLEKYFQNEGLAYKLVPIENENHDGQTGRIDSEIMYTNLMTKFFWGNMSDSTIFLDENNLRMIMNYRNNFSRLASYLISEGKTEEAKKVLDKCIELMPSKTIPHNGFSIGIIHALYRLNEKEKAHEIIDQMVNTAENNLNWYLSLSGKDVVSIDQDKKMDMAIIQEIYRITELQNDKEKSEEVGKRFDALYKRFK